MLYEVITLGCCRDFASGGPLLFTHSTKDAPSGSPKREKAEREKVFRRRQKGYLQPAAVAAHESDREERALTGRLEARLQALGSLGVLAKAEETFPCPEGLGEGHAAYDHTPVWAYEKPALARPYADASRVVFEILPPGLSPDEAAAHTKLFVFVGAAAGPEFRSVLGRDDCLILLFEPDPEALGAFLDQIPPRVLAQRRVGVFLGDPARITSYNVCYTKLLRVAATVEEGIGFLRQHARLLRLAAGVDLHQEARQAPSSSEKK